MHLHTDISTSFMWTLNDGCKFARMKVQTHQIVFNLNSAARKTGPSCRCGKFSQSLRITLPDIIVGEDDVPCCLSQRWKTAYVGFFGFILVYAVRVNLSVAIVCMVKSQNSIANSTTLNNSNISAVGLCTLDEESTVNEVPTYMLYVNL